MTVIHYAGVGLFAEVPRIDESWPRLGADSRHAVLVISVRLLADVPSTTAIKAYHRIAERLAAHDSRIILAGVDPPLIRVREHSGPAGRPARRAQHRPRTARALRVHRGGGQTRPRLDL